MLSRNCLLKSFSMVMFESSAVRAVIVLVGNAPTFARGCMENFARSRLEC